MKVLIATTAFPRWPADHRAPFILEGARYLQKAGVSVEVVAMHNPGAKQEEVIEGITVHRPRYLPDALEILQADRGGIPSAWNKSIINRFALIPFFVVHTFSIFNLSKNSDLIHANWTISGMAAWLSQLIHRKPLIITIHGSDINQAAKNPIIRYLTRFTLQQANQVIAVSQDLKRKVVSLGIPGDHVAVIPDGVDTVFFHPSNYEKAKKISFVGTLSKTKGVDILIDSFHQISELIPQYQLEVIGDGPSREVLQELVRSYQLEEKVVFTGSLSPNEVSKRIRESMLLVLPSRNEGFGVVLLEALASGTPCIGSNVGGIPDIITPEVGHVVPVNDPKALADAILNILTDSNQYRSLVREARLRAVGCYSWEIISSYIIDTYKKVFT